MGPTFDTNLDPTEDQLGFALAMRLAVPAGLGLWAMAIWGAFRLFF
jgi:hypothetical protein